MALVAYIRHYVSGMESYYLYLVCDLGSLYQVYGSFLAAFYHRAKLALLVLLIALFCSITQRHRTVNKASITIANYM